MIARNQLCQNYTVTADTPVMVVEPEDITVLTDEDKEMFQQCDCIGLEIVSLIHQEQEVEPSSLAPLQRACSQRRNDRLLTWPSFWAHLAILCRTISTLLFGMILVVRLGMEYEQYHVRRLPGTSTLYAEASVCAIHYNATTLETLTYGNVSQAFHQVEPQSSSSPQAENHHSSTPHSTLIAHCGQCGQCSTPHDIRIYDQTKTTLYKDSLHCAKQSIFGGQRRANRCLKERVGLTQSCNDCWVENILCDRKHCFFSCLYEAIASHGIHGGSSEERLNRCTKCDEVRCGPEFLKCAGANRRRSAITSDIVRDPSEVCQYVPASWWYNQEVQTVWRQTYVESASKPSSHVRGNCGI